MCISSPSATGLHWRQQSLGGLIWDTLESLCARVVLGLPKIVAEVGMKARPEDPLAISSLSLLPLSTLQNFHPSVPMSFLRTAVLLSIALAIARANPPPSADKPNVFVNIYQQLPTVPPFRLPSMPTLPLRMPTLPPNLRLPTLPPFRMPTLPPNLRFPVRATVVSRPAAVTLPPLRVPDKIVVQRVEVPRPTIGSLPSFNPIKVEYQDVPLQGGISGLTKLPPIKN